MFLNLNADHQFPHETMIAPIMCQLRHADTLFSSFRLWFEWKQRILWRSWHRTAYAVCVQCILSKMALWWCGGDELLNKVSFFFFAYKKYSLSLVKLQSNPWCHMDYFTDLLATVMDVDRGNYIAVCGRVRELSECIKNILICVPKTNEAFTGSTWG